MSFAWKYGYSEIKSKKNWMPRRQKAVKTLKNGDGDPGRTLSSVEATESQFNWFLEESMNVVPENANLSIK